MKTILVIFGGTSTEHEISRKSAASIIPSINHEKYTVLQIGITKSGRWMKTAATPDQILDGSWEQLQDNIPAVLSPDREDGGILLKKPDGVALQKVDCVWPVLHGKYGEDGTIQGLFELAGLPYVGPGVCSSAVAMDKSQTKLAVEKTGIRQADYYLLRKHIYHADPASELSAIQSYFANRCPLFVKPCSAGSSIGVTKVNEWSELKTALDEALKHDDKVLIEEAIVGREVEVAVMGNHAPKASIVGEVLSANDFYDYSAKYINSASRTQIPADIKPEEQESLRQAALTIYTVLECSCMSRVDFFLTADGTPVFNEINTLPGFTNISMYPKLWEATGVSNEELSDAMISYAMERTYRSVE